MSIPGMIDDEVTGVPQAQSPVYWDTEIEVGANLNVVERWIGYYSNRLPKDTYIDEAAIMVPNPMHQQKLHRHLTDANWEHFNSASDLVFTNPFGTRYFVAYDFYRHPRVPYRLEVMQMTEGRLDGRTGFSPLHASLWQDGEPWPGETLHHFPVPHLSFKPIRRDLGEGRTQTWRGAYGEAVQTLRDNACIHAQTCQSTYGAFGYFVGNDCPKQIYVKPRINTRDDA